MQLRREFRIAFGLIFGLQLATAFGAIALLTRMGPAVAGVVSDNVDSLEAVKDMLAALAVDQGSLSEARAAEFREAFDHAMSNVTEEEERPLLAAIERNTAAALAGDREAREGLVLNLRMLSDVNRQAMVQTDVEAQRLATAGAWAAALLAFFTFVAAHLLAERVEQRLIVPIFDIYSTLHAVDQGDLRRRSSLHKGSAEIEAIAQSVNALLDARQ